MLPDLLRRLRPHTLRRRIVVGVLALIVISFALVAVATTVALHSFLQRRLDQQLAAAGDRFSVGLEHGDRDADNGAGQFQAVAGQAAGTLGARVLNGQVTAVAVVGDHDDTAAVPDAARATLANLHATSAPRDVELAGLGDYRVVVTPGRDGDLLVTGLPSHPVAEVTRRLIAIELVVFGTAIALVGVLTAWSVRRAVRPLDRVADTAAQVAALPLASGAVSMPARVPSAPADTEVGKVSAAVNHMLEQVESALVQREASEERLRHFVADASHELRTPVAVIRSHAEYALRTDRSVTPAVARSLDRIVSESARMGHLVDDLLLLARLDSGRPLAHEDVDLTRVVLDAVGDARVAAPGHRWQLALPEDPVTVRGDRNALHQVLTNLLANARVHTPPGTTVHTTLSVHGETAELVVVDDGPGIAPDVLPTVTERFVRADEARSHSGGTGLGLAIVAAIVSAHGGSVAVTSPGRGTTVSVMLPVV
jgi:two-component system OmpR family sensor kinase